MRRLLISGDPGIRKGAIIQYEGKKLVCFQVTRNGEWHGPREVQLSCIAGAVGERKDFQQRNFVPHFLDVNRVDAEEILVLTSGTK